MLSEENHGIIYLITNIKNNKIFIGQTNNSKIIKWNTHKWSADLELENHKKNCFLKTKKDLHPLLYTDMREYGIENFSVETLLICNEEKSDFWENDFIKKLNSYDKKIGYNLGNPQGIIYLITNTTNNKLYVGQTKTLKNIKGNIKEWTSDDRLEEHKKNSKQLSTKNICPKLYEAMNLDGHDNFIIQTLLICDLEETRYHEKHFIIELNTIDEEIGYNTSINCYVNHKLENPERKVVISDEIRNKLSKNKDKEDNILNIGEILYKDKLVGYRVRISFEGKKIEKKFSSQEYTVEENFEKATKYLESIKNNEDISEFKLNNKNNDCPMNIFPKNKKGKHIGYEVNITIKGKKYTKSFCSMKIEMEEKLKMAIEYKNSLLK